jgi:mannose-6-phosphate isomerase-like protein (cupin superfamily)
VAERERERVRERPPIEHNSYEVLIKDRIAISERQQNGPIVIRSEDRPIQVNRQGTLRYYLAPLSYPDTPLQDWLVFENHVRTHSGKHRHQGGLVIYVIDGEGYSIVDGERFDWKSGDLLLLPIRPGGVEHQHYNLKADRPCRWIAFCHMPTMDNLAMEMTQIEVSPDFRG